MAVEDEVTNRSTVDGGRREAARLLYFTAVGASIVDPSGDPCRGLVGLTDWS